jgi:hypothetical protein
VKRIPLFLKWLAGGLVAIAILTGLLVLKGPGQKQALITYPSSLPQISSSPSVKPLHSLLVEVNDEKQRFAGGLLLIKNDKDVAISFIDPHLAIDLRVLGQFDLRRASHEVTTPELIKAINVAGGLSIDGAVVLKNVGLAALVDGVGGIKMSVRHPVRVTAPGVTPVQYLPVGAHLIKGELASKFAINSAPVDSPLAKLRLREVLVKVFDRMSQNAEVNNQLLSALGQSGRSTVSTVDLGSFFKETRGQWSAATIAKIALVPSGNPLHKEWKLFNVGEVKSTLGRTQPQLLWSPQSDLAAREYRLLVTGQFSSRLSIQSIVSQGNVYFVDSGISKTPKISRLTVTADVPHEVIASLQKSLKLTHLPIVVSTGLPTGTDMQLDVGKDYHITQVQNGQ